LSKTSRRLTFALALCLIALSAPPAFAAPTADFTVSANPRSGLPVTFTDASNPAPGTTITSRQWNINGTPATEATVQHTFSTAGTYTVSLTVTNDEILPILNSDTETKQVTVATRPPTANFSFGPPNPSAGLTTVFFQNESTDPDGDNLTFSWNFGDGSGPSGARNPSHLYATPGSKLVRLTVNDGKGGVDDVTQTVVVRDPSAANASFTISPAAPLVGQRVTFTSTSTPSENQEIDSLAWDLDSDGEYDDGDEATAGRTFSDPGVYRVALRVVQSNDEAAIAESTVRVSAVPQSPGQPPIIEPPSQDPPKIGRLSLLSPFPVVRLVGQAYQGRTVVSLLSIRAPRGSLVRVRCKGKGEACPKVVRRKRSKGRGPLRFKTFEGSIRAGGKLEIFVARSNRIGKYTRFKLRSSKIPLRTDACIMPGKRKPRPCPS
jgi:PKD repeat protein